jgi:DNA-binding NtrC family response regulator
LTGTQDDSDGQFRRVVARAVTYLVLAIECDRPAMASARYSLEGVDRVTLGRGPERSARRTKERGIVTLDVRVPAAAMSTSHARLTRTARSWALEDLKSTNGTFVAGERIEQAIIEEGRTFTAGRVLFLLTAPRMTPESAPQDLEFALDSPCTHVTLDPEFDATLAALERIGPSGVSVLIRGETGTGKEVLAHTIHELSRRDGPFVAVNCGAIPTSLVESQFFGHTKGAFSGALRDEPGIFRAAHRGTLFLDEIGDLPLAAQAAILRALQEREVAPVGGAARPFKVDIRVVSATHQDVEQRAANGDFRPDLLARIAGFTVTLPPLRTRTMDVGTLVAALTRRLAPGRVDSVRLSPSAAEALLRYDWPANTRELEQCLASALALAGDQVIEVSHLSPAIARAVSVAPDTGSALPSHERALRKALLVELARHGGNLTDVARAMGKARMQIHRWCKRFGIDPNVFRS